jgi:hypothetical protein
MTKPASLVTVAPISREGHFVEPQNSKALLQTRHRQTRLLNEAHLRGS